MAEFQSKLEITSKVVDLGDRVIQLRHIVSAGVHARHPFRVLGLLLIAGGAGLVASEGFLKGAAAFKLQSGGSLPLWVGFGAAGIGLFLSLFAQRNLMIRTADGARFVLPANDDETASALIRQIRHAMEAAGPPPAYGNGQAAAPALSAPEQAAIAQKAGVPLGLPQHPPQTAGRPASSGSSSSSADTGGNQSLAARLGEGYANGHAGRGAFPMSGGPEGMPIGEGSSQAQRRSAGSQTPRTQGTGTSERRGTGGDPSLQQAGREPLSLPATMPAGHLRDDGQHDLTALMDHIRRADVQHKEALLDLLRVVEDFYRGRASREDAAAHWRSFADYVMQYLSDVDGLISHTERFGRHMLSR